ncbi:MAG: hypothetical protein JW751_27870 [Polyangiaceae bacterium]|nr:hypothetical protein [Polyangiaceae bacterium]
MPTGGAGSGGTGVHLPANTGGSGAFITGGTGTGGASTGGDITTMGGAGTGGTLTGGVSTGGFGTLTGGQVTGGAPTGGWATGGQATGGQRTGGQPTGGGSPGGFATGGEATGGASTGGTTGGTASGGTATGGTQSAGAAGLGGGAGAGGDDDCPYEGHITYTVNRSAQPTPVEQEAVAAITEAMDHALDYYNCYTDFTKELRVAYVPEVATADGNPNGSIRFGKPEYMNFITAAHEISHTLGIAYYGFAEMTPGEDNVWVGPLATAELRAITGDPSAVLHADDQHFWPYGLNFTTEYESELDLINHCRMVMAILEELGVS